MTNEQILKRAIEKAVKNGWVPKIQYKANPELYQSAIIFSHNFAKAFWGEKEFRGQGESKHWQADDLGAFFIGKRWQYYLQQMVLEKDPIKYLEEFI